MTAKELTCEERIGEHLEHHRKNWQKLKQLREMPLLNLDSFIEEKQGELLAYSKATLHKIEYSWGGPADWFNVWQDDDGEIFRIVYHFSDWFDHAERELRGQDFEDALEFLKAVVYME